MRISSLFNDVDPTLSFEFFPPKVDSARKTLSETFDHLLEFEPNFVSVTYGAGGSTRHQSLDICEEMQGSGRCQVMAHLTCVGHTEEELSDIADTLWNLGIVNIMSLRGDAPKNPVDGKPSRFRYGSDLVTFLRSRHDFCCGGGCYPEGHSETPDLDTGIEHLKIKVDAGCEFLVTQMFFVTGAYTRFRDRAVRAGVTVPIVPGLMPITGFAQASKFESKFNVSLPDQLKERIESAREDEEGVNRVGIEWAAEQCRDLLAEGAPGIHFYTLNKHGAPKGVCRVLDLSGRRHVQPETAG